MMTWSALAVLAVVHMFHEKDSSPLFVGARSQKATAVNTGGVVPSPVPQTPRWHRILEATPSPTDLLPDPVTTSPPTTESPTATVVLSTISPTTQEPSPPPTFEPSKKPTALPTNKVNNYIVCELVHVINIRMCAYHMNNMQSCILDIAFD